MNVIETENLRKEYRRLRGPSVVALDRLDLEVGSGGVFGLLGPNGSGKTTTIRCLLGLAAQTSGTIRILGVDPRRELHEVAGRIGSIVESPALFPTMTARRNLELLAGLGRLPARRIDEVLEIVGLSERERDLVRTYSLGMRQRLALGAALLKDPELLILDEPANGLDPAGIKEVRHLLRKLGDEGRTVIVSSHILSEVEQICDRLAILSKGRCVIQGRVSEVLQQSGAGVIVKLDDLARGYDVLGRAGMVATVSDGALLVDASDGASIARVLAAEDLFPSELRPARLDLETVFLELTDDEEVAA